MRIYVVRNICTKCYSPTETKTTRKREARTLKGGPCICKKCNPSSNWRAVRN